eukprot:g2082.t1
MSQTLKLHHSQKKASAANLKALQRVDKKICAVLGYASYVAAYAFELDQMNWRAMDVEGTMYIVKRADNDPEYMLVILNRNNPDDMGKDITGFLDIEVNGGFVMVRPNQDNSAIDAFWFHDSGERDVVVELLQKLVQSIKKGVPLSKNDLKNFEKQREKVLKESLAAAKAKASPQLKPQKVPPTSSKKNSNSHKKKNKEQQNNVAKVFAKSITNGVTEATKKNNNDVMNIDEFKEVLLDLFHDDQFINALHSAYCSKFDKSKKKKKKKHHSKDVEKSNIQSK